MGVGGVTVVVGPEEVFAGGVIGLVLIAGRLVCDGRVDRVVSDG